MSRARVGDTRTLHSTSDNAGSRCVCLGLFLRCISAPAPFGVRCHATYRRFSGEPTGKGKWSSLSNVDRRLNSLQQNRTPAETSTALSHMTDSVARMGWRRRCCCPVSPRWSVCDQPRAPRATLRLWHRLTRALTDEQEWKLAAPVISDGATLTTLEDLRATPRRRSPGAAPSQ